MNSARDNILIAGLDDWVPLSQIHGCVTEANPSASLTDIRHQTLESIRSLVRDGLCELGDLDPEGEDFVEWKVPLDQAINNISRIYVDRFEYRAPWLRCCWLNLTDKGERLARELLQAGGS